MMDAVKGMKETLRPNQRKPGIAKKRVDLGEEV